MKKTPKSTVAKHVFGELKLKDIIPMVADCDSVTVLGCDGEEVIESWCICPFGIIDNNLGVFDREDGTPILLFNPKEKIKIVDDRVEYEGQYDFKLLFRRQGEPVRFDFT